MIFFQIHLFVYIELGEISITLRAETMNRLVIPEKILNNDQFII